MITLTRKFNKLSILRNAERITIEELKKLLIYHHKNNLSKATKIIFFYPLMILFHFIGFIIDISS